MSLHSAAIGSCQQGIDLRLVQIRQGWPVESLEWHRTNLGAPCNMLGAALGNETSQRMNNSKPLVSRADRAFALLLQGIEEAFQCLSRQVAYQELVDCFLLLHRQER